MNDWINLHALWQIVVIGLLAGAGLPALFAVGLRALSLPGGGGAAAAATAGAEDDDDRVIGGSTLGLAVAVLCFAVVLAAVGWGIYLIVAAT
ncbi:MULTISPECIES: hypothetical protein [Streptacidiphilus]|uniref:Uncharacterized protein n=2 Tax=Streptacidiphilus TaxID=228398 RepID=A0ABV6UJE7_9ACTN|nr:hypothetical protein [Streptacidiphilus jeojiense]